MNSKHLIRPNRIRIRMYATNTKKTCGPLTFLSTAARYLSQKQTLITAVVVSFFIFLACAVNPLTSGTGEETTNGRVVGKLLMQNNEPAGHTRVLLIPSAYNPLMDGAIINVDTTDSMGNYVFSRVKPGTYNILALHCIHRTRALKTGILVNNAPVSVPTDTVREAGSVKIVLTAGLKVPNSYVFIPGTTMYSLVDTADCVVILDSIPAGILPSINHGVTTSPQQSVVRYKVPVISGDTVIVTMASWLYAKKLFLNTSPAGADVSNDVYNFPVLIRLASVNFNFTEAKTNGDDIRFTKEDNTLLSYEIERWDALQAQAEIWVKLDTVSGNSTTRFIMMYWGNNAATDISSSVNVFDTANYFSGAWHLNESPVPAMNSIKDRTANHYDGTPSGSMNSDSRVDGIIGKAVRFNGTSDWIRIKRPVQDDFTIAFWMQAATNSLQNTSLDWYYGNGLVDGDILAGTMNDFGVSYLNNKVACGIGYAGKDSSLIGTKTVNDSLWHFIVVTRSHTSGARAIYVDGQSAGADISFTNSLTGPDSLSFGALGTTHRPYNGMLDEIVITNVVRSADWIKLCFMNQKAKDALVEFK